jgi:hypothetical protein
VYLLGGVLVSFEERVRFVVSLLRWLAGSKLQPDRPRVAAAEELDWLRSKKIAGLHHMIHDPMCAEHRFYQKVLTMQIAACREFLTALSESGIPALTFKGVELMPVLLSGGAPSVQQDCDVIVPRGQIERARQVALSLGYRHAVIDPGPELLRQLTPEQIERAEQNHYELATLRQLQPLRLDRDEAAFYQEHVQQFRRAPICQRGPAFSLVMTLDIHYGVAAGVPADGLFVRQIPSIHGIAGTLSPTDHLWIMLSRLYVEVNRIGKRSLRDLALLTLLLAKKEFDWASLVEAAFEYRSGRNIFYYLHFLNRITNRVPPEVLEDLRRMEPIRDLGWQLAPMFESPSQSALDDSL